MKNNIKLERFSGGLKMVHDSLKALMPSVEPNRRKIEVEQRGLATGQIVFVRVIKRVHIPVTYIASE